MKHLSIGLSSLKSGLCVLFLLLAGIDGLCAQTWIGAEGGFGLSHNGGEPINNLHISGRLHFNEALSTSLGIGLWNTGLRDTWKVENDVAKTFTLHRLREGKAMPTLQWGLRGSMPLVKIHRLPFRLYAEPYLTFLPFSSKTVTNVESNFVLDPVATAAQGKDVYVASGNPQTFTLKTSNDPKLYYGLQLGVSTELKNQLFLDLGIGYSNLDLFNSLRNQTLHGVSLNNHLPRKGLTILSLTLSYGVQAH